MRSVGIATPGSRYHPGTGVKEKAALVALAVAVGFAMPSGAKADEANAKELLKAMSDYLGAQTAISFQYDSDLEIVTTEQQKLSLASSGTVSLSRPDKIRATRTGGFADVEMVFDGSTLTVFGKSANMYGQLQAPGTIDHLVDELREKYNRVLPAADLLLPNAYDALMTDVTDVKDLGSGVIGGVECDHLAFRTGDVDLQIWIAQGDRPYPCRYVVTSKQVDGFPQYTVDIRDWNAGTAASGDFTFSNATDAKKVELGALANTDELPDSMAVGGAK